MSWLVEILTAYYIYIAFNIALFALGYYLGKVCKW